MNLPEPILLAKDVYSLQFGPNQVNAGFVVTDDGVVVIDSGPSPRAGEALRQAIDAVTDQPLAYVINTHFHSSHTFGNQAFGGSVIAHVDCLAQMNRALTHEWSPAHIAKWRKENPEHAAEFEGLRIRVPDLAFSGAGIINIGGKNLQLIHLGNHTSDSIAVHLPEQGVVFAVDNLFDSRRPFLRHANAAQWVEVLQKLEELDLQRAVPGHGAVMEARDVHNLRVYFETLLKAPRHRRGASPFERLALV